MADVRQAPPRIPAEAAKPQPARAEPTRAEPTRAEPTRAEPTTAELVQNVSEQISRLVRDELRLARAELSTKGREVGVGAGLMGGAGFVAMYGVTALLAALVIGLAAVMPGWLAAGLVGVVLLILAGVMAATGRGRVRRATPAVPTETRDSVRRDIETVSSAVRERGRR